MPYLFCILTNLGGYACIGCRLGWCFVQTQNVSLVLAIIIGIIFIANMVPGTNIFECPKCGHRDKVKVFNVHMGLTHVTAVRKDNPAPNGGD